MKLRDKTSASRSSHSHFWDKTSDRIVMCLKQKPKHMCDFFFFLQASSHIYTLKEKRQVRRYSESSAFGFISKENQKKKKSKYSDS